MKTRQKSPRVLLWAAVTQSAPGFERGDARFLAPQGKDLDGLGLAVDPGDHAPRVAVEEQHRAVGNADALEHFETCPGSVLARHRDRQDLPDRALPREEHEAQASSAASSASWALRRRCSVITRRSYSGTGAAVNPSRAGHGTFAPASRFVVVNVEAPARPLGPGARYVEVNQEKDQARNLNQVVLVAKDAYFPRTFPGAWARRSLEVMATKIRAVWRRAPRLRRRVGNRDRDFHA